MADNSFPRTARIRSKSLNPDIVAGVFDAPEESESTCINIITGDPPSKPNFFEKCLGIFIHFKAGDPASKPKFFQKYPGLGISFSKGSPNYYWQLLIFVAELFLACLLNYFGVPSDWAIALGCETVLTVLFMICPKKGEAGENDGAARICLVCGMSSFCWITLIANRSVAFLPFEFGAMVFLPAISALMKVGFTWFFGERELQASDVNAVFKFYRYHFIALIGAIFSLSFPRITDKMENISSKIKTLDTKVDGLNDTMMLKMTGLENSMKLEMTGLKGEILTAIAKSSAARGGMTFLCLRKQKK